MNKSYIKFVREIYSYCDNHIGEEVLFPFFVNCLSEIECVIEKRDLVSYTSEIASKLILKNVLKEVPKKFENFYGMYKVLPHERLIKKIKNLN